MRICALLLLGSAGFAAEPAQKPLQLRSPLQDKNFYLLSVLEQTPGARKAVKSNPVLARIAQEKLAALEHAAAACKLDVACIAAAFEWSDPQIEEAAHAIGNLDGVTEAIRSSGMYVRHHELNDRKLLEQAFVECMRGINHAIGVYGLGKPPRYPLIDAATYDPQKPAYQRILQNLVAVLQDDKANFDLAFSTSLRFAMEVMILNHRDEAARFEPMEKMDNAASFHRVKSVAWNHYPYSVIVVPGSGNDRPGVRLSPNGKLRDEIAAKRYREGKAPFILVSGGYVHPNQTEYGEAIEMKRDLMLRFHIPEEAIIVDPHARHTTTNMRNAARLMYRYGLPFDRKALVTTDPGQSQYIENPLFAKRCIEELGYVPHQLLGRTSPFDLEFLPAIESLHADPLDPLDP